MPSLEQLRVFRDLVDSTSLTQAARKNQISQSAVSQFLRDLERSYDLQLVDRKTRPLEATEAGRLYYDYCRKVIGLHEDLEISLERIKGRVQGTVRVASIYSIGLSEMSGIEKAFAHRFPDAELRVEYLRPEKVYEAVRADQADLGLVSYPNSNRDIVAVPWREEKMVVAVAPGHPLAGRSEVSAGELNGLGFIAFDDDLPIAREVNRFFDTHGVQVRQTHHFDNIQTMKEAVIHASAFSILPEPILRADVESGRLLAIPLEKPGLSRPLGILRSKRKRLNRPTQSLLNLLTGDYASSAER